MKAIVLAAVGALSLVSAHAAVPTPFTYTITNSTGGGLPSTCPDDDGSSGATPGAANYPGLITQGNYKAAINATHGLGCKVPGVDYAAGVPVALVLKDPTTTPPAGCKYDGKRYLDCTNAATINGYDFAKNGTLLTGSGTMIVTNSRFSFGSNCTDPVINTTGSLTLTHTTIDGTAGWSCNLNQGFGSFVNVNAVAGGFFIAEWNHMPMIAQDGFDVNGASSGNYAVTIKYNIGYREGSTGHPDWIQYCGGGAGVVTPNLIEHNLWYGQPEPGPDEGGIQPIHVEAQNCTGAGHIAATDVGYNTVLGTGTCKGGQNWPIGCAMNFGIACKKDDSASTNTSMKVHDNYIDWSGGITALTNGYGCGSGVTFTNNWDMTAGTVLTTAPTLVAVRPSPALAAKLKAADVARKARVQMRVATLKTLETERAARLK